METDKMENKGNAENRILEILDSFKIYDGVYKKEQVQAAIELKDEITPHLIKILQGLFNNPDQYIENTTLYDHIYATMLLGHFKETGAHQLLVDIFSLPGEMPHEIYGEICTSDLPTLLLNTCGGSTDRIKSLVLNKNADDYIRVSACHALAYAVVQDYIPRKEVVEFFSTLFTGNEAKENSDFWGLLACVIWDLYPEENLEIIKKAYNDGLIDPAIIGYDDFEKALSIRKENPLEALKDDLLRNSLDDLHKSMSWWSCFNEQKKNHYDSSFLSPEYKKSQKEKMKTKKNKRKQAKASRKKNRR
jgi:hypothetical protein